MIPILSQWRCLRRIEMFFERKADPSVLPLAVLNKFPMHDTFVIGTCPDNPRPGSGDDIGDWCC